MIIFFVKGSADSDKFIKYCYSHYADIMNSNGAGLPPTMEIIRKAGQKPRFTSDKVCFSLSHSGGVMMLALSHTEVGADIERIRPIDRSAFGFIDADSEAEFFEKWTERESYIKYTGKGLSDFRCEIPADAHFEHFEPFEGYAACVCAEEQNIVAYEVDINEIR